MSDHYVIVHLLVQCVCPLLSCPLHLFIELAICASSPVQPSHILRISRIFSLYTDVSRFDMEFFEIKYCDKLLLVSITSVKSNDNLIAVEALIIFMLGLMDYV